MHNLWPASRRSADGGAHRITLVAVVSYTLFCSLSFASQLPPMTVLGEFNDVLQMSAYAWPYPLLLAIQRIVSPDSMICFLLADLFGLALVLGSSLYLERLFGRRARNPWLALAAGLLVWPIVLGLLQGAVFLAASAADWPVGE